MESLELGATTQINTRFNVYAPIAQRLINKTNGNSIVAFLIEKYCNSFTNDLKPKNKVGFLFPNQAMTIRNRITD
jgi:ribosomal protein S17E